MALSRQAILDAAVALADASGIEAVTMRRLADELGVEAMSLYHHTPNKEALLDGMVDVLFDEVASQLAESTGDWSQRLRSRILSARRVQLRHPWAPAVIQSRRAPGVPMVRYVDGCIAIMHDGGLSYDLIHHSLHAFGSRIYGFVQELDDSGASSDAFAQLAEQLPHLVAMLAEVVHNDPAQTLGWCDDQTEFEFALDLLLDGMARAAEARAPHR
jgi:AcrR family transcriptional regulator